MKHVQCRNKREYKTYRDELIASESLRSTLVLTFPDKTRQVFSGITASDRDELLDALTADIKKAVVFSSAHIDDNLGSYVWRDVNWEHANVIERFELDVRYLRPFADAVFNQQETFSLPELEYLAFQRYQGYATLFAMLSEKTVCFVGARSGTCTRYALCEGQGNGERYLQDHGDPAYRHYLLQLKQDVHGNIPFTLNLDAGTSYTVTPKSESESNSKEGV